MTPRHRRYWHYTLALTAGVLTIWFVVIFMSAYFAASLNHFVFLGFPLGFYIFAQGALIVFLILIGAYVAIMNRLDRRFGVAEKR
ncbi:MAG TPA: DUF4212 domain-containing protein [Rhodocyclaceae bacterium]|nr:DUF4212 domain-containing protein [Zoogloeaceae bacterium]HRD34022.1 DUF4212 domain-containing protein [Rhodocyclaceae bacterium]